MLRVGVTGGIGSGKTVVCSTFEQLGVLVLYTDLIAREIMDSHAAVRKQLLKLLGPDAYQLEGRLNRPFVATRLFSTPRIQGRINAIVHPLVQKEIEQQWLVLERKGEPMTILEAALIYEAGLDKILDAVVVVEADEELRIQRMVSRNDISVEEARTRINAQMPSKEKIKKADYILRNNGSVEDLHSRVRFLHSLFLRLASEKNRG